MLKRVLIALAVVVAIGSRSSAGSAPRGRDNYVAIKLNDGRTLFAGGADDEGRAIKRAELFDPALNKFRATGPMIVPRCGPTATLLPNGGVLIAGGATCSEEPAPIRTLELFQPSSASFHYAADLNFPRFDLKTLLLNNGRVLIAQGYSQSHQLIAPAEMFDPKDAIVQPAGSMMVPRCFGSETQLPGGQVLIAGGVKCDEPEREAINAAEIFDPRGEFGRVGTMSVARVCHAATLMKNGKVLIAGGASALSNGVALDSAEIYDPAKSSFSRTGSMTKARACPTATLRNDGTVLIKGGQSENGIAAPVDLTDSEIYDPNTGKFTAASLAE